MWPETCRRRGMVGAEKVHLDDEQPLPDHSITRARPKDGLCGYLAWALLLLTLTRVSATPSASYGAGTRDFTVHLANYGRVLVDLGDQFVLLNHALEEVGRFEIPLYPQVSIFHNDTLYTVTVGDNALSAYHLNDQPTQKWSADLSDTRIEALTVEGFQLYVRLPESLMCFIPETGERVWTFSAESELSSTATAWDMVYFDSEEGTHAISADSGDTVWFTPFDTVPSSNGDWELYVPHPVDEECETVFTPRSSVLFALDAFSGTERWNYTVGEDGHIITTRVGDGVIAVGCEDGSIHLLDSCTGDLQWNIKAGALLSPLLIHDATETLYVHTSWDTVALVSIDEGQLFDLLSWDTASSERLLLFFDPQQFILYNIMSRRVINAIRQYPCPTDVECNDGNDESGDGCSELCTIEAGYSCLEWACSRPLEVCGDGLLVGLEACDDGNVDGGDGCSATCLAEEGWTCDDEVGCAEVCGDSIVVGKEMCDGSDDCFDDCTLSLDAYEIDPHGTTWEILDDLVVYRHGGIYFGSLSAYGKHFIEYDPHNVVHIKARQPMWKIDMNGVVPGVLVHGNMLIVGSATGLHSLGMEDGESQWQREDCISRISPILSDDLVIATSHDVQHLTAVNVADGADMWDVDVNERIVFTLLTTVQSVFVLTVTCRGYAFDVASGDLLWTSAFQPATPPTMEPVWNEDDSSIYFGCTNMIHAVNATDGRELWNHVRNSRYSPVGSNDAAHLEWYHAAFAPKYEVLYYWEVQIINQRTRMALWAMNVRNGELTRVLTEVSFISQPEIVLDSVNERIWAADWVIVDTEPIHKVIDAWPHVREYAGDFVTFYQGNLLSAIKPEDSLCDTYEIAQTESCERGYAIFDHVPNPEEWDCWGGQSLVAQVRNQDCHPSETHFLVADFNLVVILALLVSSPSLLGVALAKGMNGRFSVFVACVDVISDVLYITTEPFQVDGLVYASAICLLVSWAVAFATEMFMNRNALVTFSRREMEYSKERGVPWRAVRGLYAILLDVLWSTFGVALCATKAFCVPRLRSFWFSHYSRDGDGVPTAISSSLHIANVCEIVFESIPMFGIQLVNTILMNKNFGKPVSVVGLVSLSASGTMMLLTFCSYFYHLYLSPKQVEDIPATIRVIGWLKSIGPKETGESRSFRRLWKLAKGLSINFAISLACGIILIVSTIRIYQYCNLNFPEEVNGLGYFALSGTNRTHPCGSGWWMMSLSGSAMVVGVVVPCLAVYFGFHSKIFWIFPLSGLLVLGCAPSMMIWFNRFLFTDPNHWNVGAANVDVGAANLESAFGAMIGGLLTTTTGACIVGAQQRSLHFRQDRQVDGPDTDEENNEVAITAASSSDEDAWTSC